MDIKIYIIASVLSILAGIGFTYLEKYLLLHKKDTRSKIKKEARLIHYEEDHNSRLTHTADSMFLWSTESVDEGIQKKLKCQAEAKRKTKHE